MGICKTRDSNCNPINRRIKRFLVFIYILIQPITFVYSQSVNGYISSCGKGLREIIVTDGTNFTQTNAQGNYNLKLSDNAEFIYMSTPPRYLPQRNGSTTLFYKQINKDNNEAYNFKLDSIGDDNNHTFLVHTDAQLFKKDNLISYNQVINDCMELINFDTNNFFGIDCGDIVGDKPELYPDYISAVDRLNIPFYRVIGNHDMTLYVCSHETSEQTYKKYFGPTYYSFNRGKVHYIILNDVFYLGRDYFYTGYIDEKQLAWLEKDLSYVEDGSLVFVAMHIPSRLEVGQIPFQYSNENIAGRVSNAEALYKMLKPFNAHLLTGHTHYNLNLIHSENLYEHNTAAVCGTWWQGDVCLDGTPIGYGVYRVNGDSVNWFYKSVGYPNNYQLKAYSFGSSNEYPDCIIANVWNWDKNWKVEWMENDKIIGEMTQVNMIDPSAQILCSDKEKLEFPWISPISNNHMFKATPLNSNAKYTIRETDSFGNIYTQDVKTE